MVLTRRDFGEKDRKVVEGAGVNIKGLEQVYSPLAFLLFKKKQATRTNMLHCRCHDFSTLSVFQELRHSARTRRPSCGFSFI